MNGPTNVGKGRPTFGGTTRGNSGGGGGAFPGFGASIQPIGPSTVGVAPTAARSDHQHPWRHVADQAALDGLSAAAMLDGQKVWVDSYKDSFTLTASTQTVVANYRRTALGKAGYLWIRDMFSPSWWNQTAWGVNPSTGNDENVGSPASPLATMQEFERRRRHRKLPLAETYNTTVTIVGDLPDTDFVYDYEAGRRPNSSNTLTIQGTPTVTATFTITAATAINRATNVRNTITSVGIGAHVGHIVRLQATPTTTAVIQRAVSADEVELSEQSVNGALGGGFTNGQVVEVVLGSKVPGGYFGYSNNLVTFIDCNLDPAIGVQVTTDMSGVSSAVNFTRCRLRGSTTAQITTGSMTFTGCAFVDRPVNCRGRTTLNICGQVAQTTTGINITNTDGSESTMANHISEASTITIGEGTYFHVSGGGGGAGPGFFNLAAAQIGFNVSATSTIDTASMWGAGNNATSVPIQLAVGTRFSRAAGASTFVIAGGVGLRMLCGGANLDVPLAQLPHAMGGGNQPGTIEGWTAKLTAGVGAVTSYAGKDSLPAANNAVPIRLPTSERLALRLRSTVRLGALDVIATGTVFKNNVATTMVVTVAAGAAVGTNAVDSAHPTLFADGDEIDVVWTAPIGTGDLDISSTVEFAT